jgi:hypothetical protein
MPSVRRRLKNQRRFLNTVLPNRTTAVLIAIIYNVLLISAAALTTAYIRFESLLAAVVNELRLVIIPAFLLAAFALDYQQIMMLRHSPRSVETTTIALAITAGLTFVAAFVLQVGVIYLCLPPESCW